MAYNQYREWDRGKDAWNDGSAWNDSRGNVRGREEDYYGDGKRRKFNNGGFDNSYSHEDANYGQMQRPNDYAQDYTVDERPQQQRGGPGGNFTKKRMQPSEPSPHVIFLGLDTDFTEADLQAYLVSQGCNIETVTIIREKSTGASKGFGFAQFPTTEHARAFVDPSFPFVQVPPPASHGASAATAFYKALETGAPHNGRRVKIDYSQSAQHDKGRQPRQNGNDGTRDIGNAPGPVLLFRGLDPLSGPQAIHQAMRYSSGVGKEGAKGMKRIILIKDRVTMASFGFAFVEFIDVESAANVLGATMSAQIHPNGFRISDKPVAASWAHPCSFQPADPMLRDEAAVPSSMSLGAMEGGWVRYWDEASTIAVLEFKVEAPAKPANVVPTKEKEKKKKAKVEVKDVIAAPSVLPISDKPVTLNFSKGPIKIGTSAASKPLALGFSLGDGEGEDADEDAAAAELTKAEAAKKVAPLIASKKTVNNINKWNQVQEELTQSLETSNAASTSTQAVATPSHSNSPAPSDEFEYADTSTMACLLCARQFKTLDQLKRHNKESDLHKKNLKDSNLREVARQKVLARQQPKAAEQPKYRDRAFERRALFNQPDVPLPESSSAGPSKAAKKRFEGPPPPPSPPPPAVHPGKDETNVGNKLLKMMGWKEGTGLGTDGDGRVEPIQTAIYAQGVGLGASKPRDIGKLTEGYSGYVNMAQDAARERYNS
ncbi:hypothetical protein PLEOSDRAFT_1091567 [Pleurotus ostreatus PC15]|uniref:G-patch domain-containing protein n=1 Tax=Pleurotus ostreatus (strain PC15) TaxID=1137138 RepID=A0A067P2Z3_PLEO1|nr:hypothetical protein PLEOSDRAFT_1091567 [Pleurotus ostreatus PC15]